MFVGKGDAIGPDWGLTFDRIFTIDAIHNLTTFWESARKMKVDKKILRIYLVI